VGDCESDCIYADEEATWVKTLAWKAPELVPSRQAALDALEHSDSYIESRVRRQDSIFAHYATAALLVLCPHIETFVFGYPTECSRCSIDSTAIVRASF
jgi:hypothetical protein